MDMKQQRFGIEIELTGIARKRGAEIVAAYFGTQSYYAGTYYDIYAALDPQGRGTRPAVYCVWQQFKSSADGAALPVCKSGRGQ